MSIRHKLLLFTPLLVALPLLAWFTLQATEAQFREVEGASLASRAQTAAATLPAGLGSTLQTTYGVPLPAPALPASFRVDGYTDDWNDLPAVAAAQSESLAASLWAGSMGQRLALRLQLTESAPSTELVVIASGSRGLLRFTFPPLAEGPVRAFSAGGQQVSGVVQVTAGGNRVLEFTLPASLASEGLRLQITDGGQPPLQPRRLDLPDSDTFYVMARPDDELRDWLQQVTPEAGVGRLVVGSRVLLTAGTLSVPASPLEQFLYRWVFEALPLLPDRETWVAEHSAPDQESSAATLRWFAADSGIPVMQALQPLSENLMLVLQAPASATLEAIDTVWLQLMLGSLLVFGLVVLGLLLFSTRLVTRIRQLSGAAAQAAHDPRRQIKLPQSGARDEIGELARAHGHLLASVGDYARYLDSLAGRLSHELRTPLAITRSSLDNLDEADHADRGPYLERARQGLDRQADLISALTEASRLDQALTQGDHEVVDLVTLLGQYLEALQGTRDSTVIETDFPSDPVHIRAQPDRLVQLLDKLFDNALSFAGDDGRISCLLELAGEQARITIFNQGPPLPEGDTRQLFDSLVSSRPGGGRHLGLGLYIARQIVRHHEGRIQAENHDDGVAITVTLPRVID